MQVRFWGTRGSVPTPGPATNRYGGNTSCVEVRANDGTHIILDCGTGARQLGQELLQSPPHPLRLYLFIGHIHWDHIQGFPFFLPAFLPDTELNVYAPRGFERNLEEALAGQMQHSYFPVKLRELSSRIKFTQLEEGFFRVGNVLVETQHLNHTAPTIAYRISSDGATVAYSTDHEPFWKPGGLDFRHPGDQRHTEFLAGADLVIHDAQYTETEYPHRVGWGHSTVEYATDVAVAGGVQRLALFHHDPSRDDTAVEQLEQLARTRAAASKTDLDVFAAAEGLVLDIQGRRRTQQVAQVPATGHQPIAGSLVLVVGSDDEEWTAIDQVLQEDHLLLVRIRDERAAIEQIHDMGADLVIIDAHVPGKKLSATVDALRQQSDRPNLPVLLLAAQSEAEASAGGGARGVTDYLARPFSPPMLRSRVRAWLARVRAEAASAGAAPTHARTVNRRTVPDPGQPEAELTTREEMSKALATVPLFRALSGDEIALLSARALERFFHAGQTIIRQGDRTDELFVILSGRVRVHETPEEMSGTELVLGELGPGEILGELRILTDMPRSATVVAADQVHCVAIPGPDFLRVVHTAPSLGGALAQMLARRIYETDRRLARYAPDPLTGLLNRRGLEEQYARYAAQTRRRDTAVLLLLLDIKNLRGINDEFGYSVGDEVVRIVAEALLDSARRADLVARYGGDEFVVLPVDAQPEAIGLIVERIERRVAELAASRGIPARISCAVGVGRSPASPESLDELVRLADEDMQRRKSAA